MTDAQLLALFAHGKHDGRQNAAVDYIYNRSGWARTLQSYVAKEHPQLAKDVVQDTMLTFIEHIGTGAYRGKGSLYGYFFGIGKKKYRDMRRSENRLSRREQIAAALRHPRTDVHKDPLQAGETLADAQRQMKRLPEDQRLSLDLAAQGYTSKEIAERLGLPGAGTVRTQIHRARTKLKYWMGIRQSN